MIICGIGEVVEQKWQDLVDTFQRKQKSWGRGHDSRGAVGLVEVPQQNVFYASLYSIKKVGQEKVCIVPIMKAKKNKKSA